MHNAGEYWRVKYPYRISLPSGITVRGLKARHDVKGGIVVVSEGGPVDYVDCELEVDADYLTCIAFLDLA